MGLLRAARNRLILRLQRRRLQVRATVKARELQPVHQRWSGMGPGPVLFSTMRNEAVRLPYFLDYYRKLGIAHFFIIDNGSTDDTASFLATQTDVSLWSSSGSYRGARFGVDWLNALLSRHGAGRWCLVVDPDEFLVYPHCDTRKLPALTRWLDSRGHTGLAVLLLDMYGDGPVSRTHCRIGEDPIAAAPWFDAGNYVVSRDAFYQNLWIQGGPRQRVFFADDPRAAPALNKIPLVKWQRGYVYKAGAHDLLPRKLNQTYARKGGSLTSGVLLHAKFMDVLSEKVAEEMERRQHYADSAEYLSYAEQGDDIALWTPQSIRYEGWAQLCDLGLMAKGGWL